MRNPESSDSTGTGAPSLLERERELALLDHALESAGSADARVVLIEGDPGLGKTSLIDWVGRQAERRGFTVLCARGGSLERTFGWGVARQLFEPVVGRAAPSRRRSLLRGSAGLAAPVLGLDDAGEVERGPVKDFRLEHGLFWLVCNLAERSPLAVLVDDVQWCDDATLEWFVYLVRRCEHLPLLVVLAARSGEPTAPRALLDMIAAEPVARSATLSPLGRGATEELLGRAYGARVDGDFGRACHEWTGGNPLFVAALADELATEGVEPVASSVPRIKTLTPAGVSRVMLLRLARMSGPARDLARAVAVLESSAEVHWAFQLAELTAENGIAALDELAAARVLGGERPVRFTHPLIAGVVYDDVPPAHRAMMHKRAAQLLVDADVDPGRTAAHLLRTTPSGEAWIVAELRRAAEHELARGSPATAVELLRRARAETPADRSEALLLELGRCEVLAGDPIAMETLRTALSGAVDPRARAEIALMLGRLLLWSGDMKTAVAIVAAEGEALGWEDTDLRLQLEAFVINAARADMDLVGVIPERLAALRERAQDDTYGGRLIAAQLSWGLAAIAAPIASSLTYARRALADGRLIDESPNAPDAYLATIHMLAIGDALDEADELYGKAIAVAQENGSAPAFAGGSCFRGYCAYLRGQLDEAELMSRDALRICEEARALTLVRGLSTAVLVLALVARGAMEDADAFLPEEPLALEDAPETWATEMLFASACASVSAGRLEEGLAALLGCGQRAKAWGVITPAWLPWRSEAALVLRQLQDMSEAVRLCDEELELARRVGAPRPLGVALRARGVLEGGAGGIALLRESAAALGPSPARLEYARTLVALGAALRRGNARSEARAQLSEGLALAEHCAAMPLANEARAELAAIGARPRSTLRAGADALTASERRVCELAASGKSNPEIAQLLFVTRATVESHLHSAYRTLDITSRKQLPAALAEQSG